MGRRIDAAAFEADCLRILDEVARNAESVTETTGGCPIAEIMPVDMRKRRSIIGAMRGTVLRYDHPFHPAIEPTEWQAQR
jgi:antitoxin (DNA-binding transcriptional repressor) of toxin-antitoxin stability system